MDGHSFRSIRKACGYTQKQLATIMGVCRKTISNWEKLRQIPALAREFASNLTPATPSTAAKPVLLPSQLAGDLVQLFNECVDHLDYTGWGDSYEREGAMYRKLPERVEAMQQALQSYLGGPDT
jgi:DNA-binding XRE family transcriptional regulator